VNKLFSLFTVAALVATTSYADMPSKNQASDPCACLEQGMALPSNQKCYPAAYNAPAAISVRDGWDFNATASFIYWHVSQENMVSARQQPIAGVSSGTLMYPEFEYKPGFKVGFGFDTSYDDWSGFAEYTWMHQTTSHTSKTDVGFLNPMWGVPSITNTSFFQVPAVHTNWKMHFDMLDAGLSRAFYQSKKITLTPFAGMRGLWIRQHYTVEGLNDTRSQKYSMKSHSWAVGPMMGTVGHWMIGSGFRMEGKTGAALLYTSYHKIRQSQETYFAPVNTSSSVSDVNVLRPMADFGVGLGWGTYLDGQSYYFDLSLRYDFNIFWDQNMMAQFVSGMNTIYPGHAAGNLYMHGLTLSTRFDF
jgi:hypothetical protein